MMADKRVELIYFTICCYSLVIYFSLVEKTVN
jgi:hypothetical protein